MRFQKEFLRTGGRAFTLIELLVVISIIAVLAGLVLSGVLGVKGKAMTGKARSEAATIVSAIAQYQTDYGRPPCTKRVWDCTAANGATNDFTYGIATPLTIRTYGSPNYATTNAEIVAVLRNTGPTTNLMAIASSLNPKKGSYLDAPVAVNNISSGVGPDGVFRDPWGSPYIISIDMDASGTTTDGFYRRLIETKVRTGNSRAGEPEFANYPLEVTAPALVWSLGPDGRADANPNLTTGEGPAAVNKGPKAILQVGDNKDNVLSWDR